MFLDEYCGSPFWDTSLSWNTSSGPRLTDCFRYTVLIWLPCVFLWLWSSYHVYTSITSKSKHIPWTCLNISKFILCILIILLELSYLIYKLSTSENILLDRLIIHSLVFKCATFALSFYLDILSKKHGIRSSGVQFLFWFLLFICQLVILYSMDYSYGMDHANVIVELVYTALITIQLLLNCWADGPPMYTENGSQISEKSCPETSASFLSRIFFFWFERLARKGHQKPLEFHDLWELPPENLSKSLNSPFIEYWNDKERGFSSSQPSPELNVEFKNNIIDMKPKAEFSELKITQTPERGSIMSILVKTFGSTFLLSNLLKLIQDLLIFTTPLILKRLIRHAETKEHLWKGYFYMIILLVVTVTGSLVGNQYLYRMYLLGLRIRTTVTGCMYRKSLKISRNSNIGEIVNLMSVDTQKLIDIMPYLTIVWSAPLQIGMSLYFLYTDLLGSAVFAGFGVMILMLPISAIIGIKIKAYHARQLKTKDKRIKLMNEIINGIKLLKLYGWESTFQSNIAGIRASETKILKQSAVISSIAMFIWTCAPVVVAIVTFAAYVLISDEKLNAEKIFVSLSYLNIIRIPLNLLPIMIVSMIQSTVSFKRINNYLNMPEVEELPHNKDDECPIVITNGNFSWKRYKESKILSNINMKVKNGQLVGVIGPVGCGKSSLLSAILGEMGTEGYINVNGSIAYVSQLPWLQNTTIRDNILFGSKYNESKYKQVIVNCALELDLDVLIDGDMTIIGENGINLSGGQKQRISIARAIYNNAELYLLDDPLSAIDSNTGKCIFDNVIGPNGMLSKKTRVLVTNNVNYLTQMDQIIIMKSGEIIEQGSYQELVDKNGISDFLMQQINTGASGDAGTAENHVAGGDGKKPDAVEDKKAEIVQEDSTTKLIDDEKVEVGIVKWHVLLYYLKCIGWRMILFSLLFQIVFQLFSVGSNVWLAAWSDSNDNAKENSTFSLNNQEYLTGYTMFGVGQSVAIFLANLIMAFGTLSASHLMHNGVLNRVLRAPIWFFDVTPVGRIINRLSKDVEVLDSAVSMSLTSWIKCLFNVISTMILITYTTPWFIIVVIPTTIVYTMAQRYYIASSRQLRRLESVTRSPIYSHFTETLAGTSTIRAFGLQELFINKSESMIDQNQACYFASIVSARFLATLLETLGNLVIFFATFFIISNSDHLTAGLVGLTLSYALQITHALNWLVETTNNVENNLVAVERLKEYNEIEQEADWDGKDTLPKSWPENGEIEFRNYETKYRDELDLVLNDLSFRIQPQEKVGICGRTGAGKSSLVLALFRLIEPTTGSIIIDGKNINDLGLHQLRKNLTIIPQDPVIFTGSIRNNLDPFNLYSDDDLWYTLNLVHLKEFVTNDIGGLDVELIDGGGTNLSVGQRQLICLARALLRKSKILILDEATASIDLETDELIQQTIRAEFKDCTIITIAHRLNTIMDYTRILVLDQGTLQEFDTPANLLQNPNSIFYGLAKDAGLVPN